MLQDPAVVEKKPLGKLSLAEFKVAQAQEVLSEVLGDFFFKVDKADFARSNENVMNVRFSDDTDVEKVLELLVKHSKLHPQYSLPPAC